MRTTSRLARSHHIVNAPADLFGRLPDEQRRNPKAPLSVDQIALRIWGGAVDPHDTLTEKYLAGLGLPLPEDACGHAIRHHGSLHFSEGRRLPGMLTLVRNIRDNRPCAIVRTYLDEHANKITQRLLGSVYQAAIKLDPDEHVSQGLHVTVGVEAGVAALTMDYRPLWAFANTEALSKFAVSAAIDALTVLVGHNDDERIAAEQVSGRWQAAGREVRVIEMQKATS